MNVLHTEQGINIKAADLSAADIKFIDVKGYDSILDFMLNYFNNWSMPIVRNQVGQEILHSNYTNNPEVSIVVCAHNEELVLLHTLEAIAECCNSTSRRVEVVVIDNASVDDTHGIAEWAGARVVDDPIKGLAHARQRGLEEARGGIVIASDADIQPHPKWVDAHCRHYEDTGNVGVRGGIRFDHVHPLYHCFRGCRDVFRGILAVLNYLNITSLHSPFHISGANLSYRKNEALKVGYVPGQNAGEDLFMAQGLMKLGNVPYDGSSENTVVTDGRRFSTAGGIAYTALTKLGMLLGGQLYNPNAIPRDFTDIRKTQDPTPMKAV